MGTQKDITFNRAGILKARQQGLLDEDQARNLLDALIGMEPGATLTRAEANDVVQNQGGTPDRRGGIEKFFQAFNPFREESNLDTGIPLPFSGGQNVSVNAPLGLLGLTALSLGATAPAGGALAATRVAPLIGSRSVVPGLNALRGATAASRFGGFTGSIARTTAVPLATAITGGIIGTANQPAPDFAFTDLEEGGAAPDGSAAGKDIANLPGGKATLDDETDPTGPITRNPVIDSNTGEPVPGQFFYTQDGVVIGPGDVRLTPDQQEQQFAFSQTKEGAEFAAKSKSDAINVKFERDQQLAGFARQREESIRQGNFEQARAVAEAQNQFLAAESKRQRDASFINALLPILASPGSRFRFAANVSRLSGGQAQFTPTEQFDRLFRFSGFQPGNPVPLTGEQNFSIIPNIQQFSDQGPRALEELEAIVGESSGQELGTVQRRSRRLAPPR